MTTRDPRSRHVAPSAFADVESEVPEPGDGLFDRAPDPDVEHPSLALGTHEKQENHTRADSPAARQRTPPPAGSRPPPLGDPDDPALRIGTQLGSYRVTQLLGKGGMGYVYRAEHVKLAREVALKLLRADYARRRDAVARFIQEARTVNLIRHRNIVDVPDIVELDDGTTFIVMELLSGISLGKWARSGVDLPRALAVLVQICDGLAAAHAVGVIHRDLKPDNVIVSPTADGAELVKLLDFGVAKLLNRDDEDIGFQTAAGSVIGTPAYMSPEQAGGMAIDHRSDIYSLGAIMYELFCGQAMFRGRSFGEYVRKHLTEMPVRPRATAGGKDLDERIEALILKCLEKDPNQRFANIAELRDALFQLLGGQTYPGSGGSQELWRQTGGSHSRPPTPSPLVRAPTVPSLVSAAHISQISQVQMFAPAQTYSAQPPPPAKTAWWVWAAGGLVAIGLGIGAAVWVAGGHGEASKPVAPAAPGAGAQPAAVAAPTPAGEPPLAAKTTSVRFDSLPAASVYADGHAAELCRTPCSYDVDLRDGGPPDRRTFVVRQAGYQDARVEVDVTAAHPMLSVTLDRMIAATPPPPPPPPPTDHAPAPVEHPPHGAHAHAEPKPPATPPPAHAEPKPPTKKPGGDSIDQTETLDPFHTK